MHLTTSEILIFCLAVFTISPNTCAQPADISAVNAYETIDTGQLISEPPRSESDTPSSEESLLPGEPVKVRFELINCSLYQRITGHLDSLGIARPEAEPVAMGFECPVSGSSKRTLAVITLGADNTPVKTLFPVDDAFYEKFRSTLLTANKPATLPPVTEASAHVSHGSPQDGRLYFMINTTARSLYVYPFGFATAVRDPDERIVSGLVLLSAGVSLYGSYLFSRTLELGYGRVEFMNYGSDMGGITIPTLLSQIDPGSRYADEIRAYSGMFGFPLGILIGSRLSFADNHAYGNASLMTNLSRFAPLYGFFITALYYNDDLESDTYLTMSSLLSLGFTPLGFYLGNKLALGENVSAGRSIITTTTGILGGMTLPALLSISETEEYRAYFGLALLGHAGGTILGRYFKRTQDYSFAQGVFTAVSAVVGTGVGLSLPLIATTDRHQPYTVGALAGCWGGFFVGERLSLTLFEKSSHDRHTHGKSSISFPGVATIPVMIALNTLTNRSDTKTSPSTVLPQELFQARVTLMDVRF